MKKARIVDRDKMQVIFQFMNYTNADEKGAGSDFQAAVLAFPER